MNDQEAITRAEAWYRQHRHDVAAGHITLDAEAQELRDGQFLCIDLVAEQGTAVINVVVDLTGAEPVALLDEGVRCLRCARYAQTAGKPGAVDPRPSSRIGSRA